MCVCVCVCVCVCLINIDRFLVLFIIKKIVSHFCIHGCNHIATNFSVERLLSLCAGVDVAHMFGMWHPCLQFSGWLCSVRVHHTVD